MMGKEAPSTGPSSTPNWRTKIDPKAKQTQEEKELHQALTLSSHRNSLRELVKCIIVRDSRTNSMLAVVVDACESTGAI